MRSVTTSMGEILEMKTGTAGRHLGLVQGGGGARGPGSGVKRVDGVEVKGLETQDLWDGVRPGSESSIRKVPTRSFISRPFGTSPLPTTTTLRSPADVLSCYCTIPFRLLFSAYLCAAVDRAKQKGTLGWRCGPHRRFKRPMAT